MKTITAALAAIVCCALCTDVRAEYGIADKGMWPESWPKELEQFRKQSRTSEAPMAPFRHYEIPFTKREEFEAAWPHLLKIKSKGAPIILIRGPKTDFFAVKPAGVQIHTPPVRADKQADPEEPLPSKWTNVRAKWMNTSFIELVVDGNIVDLNRIQIPADTPIIDERFKSAEDKAPAQTGPGK